MVKKGSASAVTTPVGVLQGLQVFAGFVIPYPFVFCCFPARPGNYGFSYAKRR